MTGVNPQMANNNNDDELGVRLNLDTKKFEQQLAAIYKRVEAKSLNIKVGVQFDPQAAQKLVQFQQQIGQAFKGTNQSSQIATQQLQSFFSAVSRGTNSLAKNSANFGAISGAFKKFANDLSNAKINQKNGQDVSKFFRDVASGTNALMRATKNVDAMVAAINKLIGRLQILQKTGQLDILKNLPANMGFTEKGGIRMQPIKIVAPNEAEWNKIKAQMETRIASKPIKAKIEPEMSNQGLQKFQNLLIALSFGQFSQNLERMSRQIISSYSSIEQAQTTLRTVYRDQPARADKIYGFLAKKEQETPATFEEMLQGGTQFAVQERQMRKYGFDVPRAVNMASELSAAFGQGKPGALMDIQTGISRLMTADPNGFEILDKYGISRSSLRQSGLAVGKTGVSLKSDSDIQAVLEAIERFQMKTTGGNLAERQNQTVAGQISNMQSQLMKTQASLMAPLEDTFRQLLTATSGFLKVIEDSPEVIRGFLGAMILGTTAFLKAAQQVSSVGLLVLGANNAGLFDGIKKKAAQTAVSGGTDLVAAGAAGGATAAAPGLIARLFPTFSAWFAGIFETGLAAASMGVGEAVTAFFATSVGGAIMAAGTAIAGAFSGSILAPIAVVTGALALLGTAMYGLATAASGAVAFVMNLPTMVDDFFNKDRRESEAFTAKWNSNTPEAQKRRQRLSRGRELSGMSGEELKKAGVERREFSDAIAANMEKQRDIESKKMTPESKKELEELQEQLDKLRDKRNDYNSLVEQTIRATETELQIAKATNQVKLKLGQITQAQYAHSLQAIVKNRQDAYNQALKTEDPNQISVAYQALQEALADVYDEHLKIRDIERDHIKNAADLAAATGGTAQQAIDFGYTEASLMPGDTEPQRIAREAKLNSIHGQEWALGQARQRRGYDYLEGTGNTLEAQIGRFRMEGDEAYRATGGKGDRAEIDKITNQKILQARFDFYQQLLKLAQENLQALQGIETQRLATAKASNDSAMTLLGGRMGRMNIEDQLSSNPEMKRLALKQQDLIMNETKLRQQQAKAKYDTELQQLTSALNNAKAKGGVPAAQLSSMQRQIELRKEAFRGEKGQISAEGAASLAQARQGESFRNQDLTREAAQTKLEDQAEAARIKREKLEADMGKSKEKYIDLLKQQLKLELDILKAKLEAALKDPKLTKQQRENLQAQYDNDVNAAQTKYGGLASDSKVAGYQTKIETYKSAMASDPKMKPKDQLMNLKKQLELEKAILFEKYKKDAAQPGADKLALQKNYLKDLNNLQLEYLDKAKQVTGEMDAQNKALEDRYRNKDKKGMFSGFSMGEVFGIEDLADNMAMDSEYSKMKYDQLGTKNGFDPFSKDKWDVKDYANQSKQDAYRDEKLGKIPANMKELEKADIKAEFTLKVELPDGSTKTYQAYNGNLPNGLKGNK